MRQTVPAMNAILQRLHKNLADTIGELDPAEMQTRVADRWSIQQIVEHLILTYSATETVLVNRLTKGRATGARPTMAQRLGQIYVMQLGFFPSGRSAPAQVTPSSDLPSLSGTQLVGRAADHLQQMDLLLDRTSDLFGEQKKSVSHIVLGPLSPQQWRKFHLVHGLHHVRQVQKIKTSGDLRRSQSDQKPTPPGQSAGPLHQ